jgi:hypothetical protein
LNSSTPAQLVEELLKGLPRDYKIGFQFCKPLFFFLSPGRLVDQ